MSGGFANPVVGKEDLIREAIRSPGFVSGSVGWRIARDGSAEFNNVVVRGDLDVTSANGSYVRAELTGNQSTILMRPRDYTGYDWNPARLSTLVGSPGSGFEYPVLMVQSPWGHDTAAPPSSIAWAGPSSTFDQNAIIVDAMEVRFICTGTYPTGPEISIDGNIQVAGNQVVFGDLAVEGDVILSSVNNSVVVGNYGAMTGGWTSFTPTWTGSVTNPTLGNGSLVGHYQRVGSLMAFTIKLTIGGTTSTGTGAWGFSLPVAPDRESSGAGVAVDDSATSRFPVSCWLTPGSGVFRVTVPAGGAGMSSTTPFTWATSDTLILSGMYSAA